MNPSHDPTLNPKHSRGIAKTPMHLLPPPALRPIAQVLGHGAAKYTEYNWRDTSVAMTVYIAAALRHLTALMDGETMDPDSGLPHAAHVAAGMMIILDAGHNGTLIDDRNKTKEWRDRTNPDYKDAPFAELRGYFKDGEFVQTMVTSESCMDAVSKAAQEAGVHDSNPHRGSEFKAEDCFVYEEGDTILEHEGLPPCPVVPDGYRGWVYRGKKWSDPRGCNPWVSCIDGFSEWGMLVFGVNCARPQGFPNNHYLEAVK